MSLRQRALRGATWAVAGGNASQLLAFVLFMIISRMVGPAAFGTVAVSLALVELCRALFNESVAGNLVARGRFDDTAFSAGFVMTTAIAGLQVLALWALAPLLAILFQAPALTTVLPQISLLLVLYAASRLQEAHLMLDLRFDALALRSVLAVLIGGAAGIGAAWAGYGVEALILQQWISALVSLLLLWIACPWRPRFTLSPGVFAELARQSAALAPAGLLAQLAMLVDGLVVASLSGPAAAGLYNLGKRARLALQLGISTALARVSLPTFARNKQDLTRLADTVSEAMRLSMVLAFPIFLGIAAVAPELIALFLGPEWAPAATPLAFLMIAGALAITSSYCDNLMLVMERRSWIAALRLGMLAVLVLGMTLVGRQGPAAVAACALAATMAHNIAAWIAASRLAPLKISTYLTTVAIPFAISLAMLAMLMALRDAEAFRHISALPRLVAFVALGAVFYMACAWVFARRAVEAVVGAARTVLAV
ncbi:oligosaccharide flippase family protein [Terricaulis sp.]|uniref:oligosaccharide flippase family protein n=1 Tax=Terricaulis sp. TaxID=2768686 RepID=UPI003785210E